MKKKNNSGFTLIELLAVIIIVGILMIIAIPSVTTYINNSRKSAYIDTAKEIVAGARNKVNEGKLEMFDTEVIYYIPSSYIETENASKSPFGEFLEAYVGVTYDGQKYNYYWISVDETGQGVKEVTPYNELVEDKIESNLVVLDIRNSMENTEIDGRKTIKELKKKESGLWEWDTLSTDSAESNIPDPVSFSTDSWETIIKAVKSNNTSVYSIGDTKEIEMGDFGTHVVRISNKSTPSECSISNFSQTACGFVLEFADSITKYYMSKSSNLGGWPASDMREYVSTTIFDSLPEILKQNIISTKVVSGYGSSDSSNFTSNDKLYLLSSSELCSSNNEYDTASEYTRKLDIYSSIDSCSNISPIKNPGYWWLRSISKNSSTFMHVKYGTNVSLTGNGSSVETGVSPAFRLG